MKINNILIFRAISLILLSSILFACGGGKNFGETQEGVEAALQAHERGKYEEAINLYTDVLKDEDLSDKNKSVALYKRGNAHLSLGNFDVAIDDYSKALEINPNFSKAFSQRGIAYEKKGLADQSMANVTSGMAYAKKEEYDLAIAEFSSAIKINPDNGDIYYKRGKVYALMEKHDEAIQDYSKALEQIPDNPFVYYRRGSAHLAKGEKDLAIRDYTTAIELKPDYADAFYSRGNVYSSLGQKEVSIADFTRAIERNPEFIGAYINRGADYFDRGQYDQAINDYTKALRIKPDYADVYKNRGNANKNKGDYHDAIDDYSSAIELDPGNARVYFNRGWAQFYLTRYKKAIEDFEQASRIDPKNVYAVAWLYLARHQEGKEGLTELEIQSRNVNLKIWPGPVASLLLGKSTPEDVLLETKHLDKKVENGRLCEAYFFIGEYYLLRGEKNLARKMFEQAIVTGVTTFNEYASSKVELNRL
ncbi:MAG: tetratricopeptide repeat protein [Nitrospinales bacterium]